MSDVQCQDLTGDRNMGEYWEREFCWEMARRGKAFTAMQIGRKTSAQWHRPQGRKLLHFCLPDVTIWTSPMEHHEIKHKTATHHGQYGLEKYRFEALLDFARETGQPVKYTIHDHHGKRHKKEGVLADWITVDVMQLLDAEDGVYDGNSWVNSRKRRVPIMYWNATLWEPLFP